jgi:hypothetical protein
MRTGWKTVALLGALGWAGCGDDDGDVPIDAGSDATIEDAGGIDAWMRGDAGTTASWTVTVRDLVSGNRLQLAEVCVVDVPQLPCAITDTEGRATLDVPIDLELQLRTTALRYVPTVTTYVSDAEPRSVGVDMPPTSALRLLGGSVEPGKGQLAFVVQNEAGDGHLGHDRSRVRHRPALHGRLAPRRHAHRDDRGRPRPLRQRRSGPGVDDLRRRGMRAERSVAERERHPRGPRRSRLVDDRDRALRDGRG